jgi:sialidase-1
MTRRLLVWLWLLVIFQIVRHESSTNELSAADPALVSGRTSTQALFVSNDGTYRRYRIPSLVTTGSDTLLAICEGRAGGGGLTGDVDLVLRRSRDGGATWSPLQVIADLAEDTLGNPCPVVDRSTGTVWLSFTRSPGKFTETQIVTGESSGPTTVWVTHSDDDGVTWSPPRDISATTREKDWGWYGTGPGRGIELRNGRLLIPSYHTERDADSGEAQYRSHVIFSDDHGQTWQRGDTVGWHTAECQAIERRDGAVVLNMRGTNRQGFRTIAISRNGGRTWSVPQLDHTLTEPACQASLLSVTETTHTDVSPRWLFCNPPGDTRRNLTLRISRDEGQSWPVQRLIDAGPTEYSCLTLLPGGDVGLLYELSRPGVLYRPELHFIRIPLADLLKPDHS